MAEETDYWQCPNCGCFFSMEEFDEQHCSACGWPDEDEDEYIDEDEITDTDIEYY